MKMVFGVVFNDIQPICSEADKSSIDALQVGKDGIFNLIAFQCEEMLFDGHCHSLFDFSGFGTRNGIHTERLVGMVDEIGQGFHGDVGISHEGIDIAQLFHFWGQPFWSDAIGSSHIRHATDHLAVAVIDAQETSASTRGGIVAEADVDVGFTTTLGSETTEVIASEQGQENDLVAQQRKVMGDITPYPTRSQAHRARVGVARHKGAEARGDNVGIRSANHTDSHDKLFFSTVVVGAKIRKSIDSTSTGMTYKSKKHACS
jgi:hypothetical protein